MNLNINSQNSQLPKKYKIPSSILKAFVIAGVLFFVLTTAVTILVSSTPDGGGLILLIFLPFYPLLPLGIVSALMLVHRHSFEGRKSNLWRIIKWVAIIALVLYIIIPWVQLGIIGLTGVWNNRKVSEDETIALIKNCDIQQLEFIYQGGKVQQRIEITYAPSYNKKFVPKLATPYHWDNYVDAILSVKDECSIDYIFDRTKANNQQ